jgi:hypothetical protein
LNLVEPLHVAQFVAHVRHGEIFAGFMSGPRSSPTTCRPAFVSSPAMMLPVQPMPTMTASTSFNRVVMAAPYEKSAIDCGSGSYRLFRYGSITLA